MMKKFAMAVALSASLASFSTPALAVHEGEMRTVMGMTDISLDGSVDIRSRNFKTLSLDKNDSSADQIDTQQRVRLGVNMKSGEDMSGRLVIENDWDSWGRFERPQGNATNISVDPNQLQPTSGRIDVREAWLNFRLPGLPAGLKGGHQLLQLGNAWFFRSMKYGSDAWVLYNVIGGNQLAIVNVKISEGATGTSDDIDAYVLLDVYKLNESNAVGFDITAANDRRNSLLFGNTTLSSVPDNTRETQVQNLGLNYNGKLGPVALKAEVDIQAGKAKGNDGKFKGNQVVLQGNLIFDPIAVNVTAARGSGPKDGQKDFNQFVNFLDADQHYTLLYEYKIGDACGGIHEGFCNTTAISAGLSAAITKSLTIGADAWFLQATEKVKDVQSTSPTATTTELGTEIDAKINWKMYDNLSWNWNLGIFMPGNAYKKDSAMGAQGVLSYQF